MTGQRLHITQGQHAVGDTPDTVIVTLLGSCVSCCIWDEVAGVGGMNHMLLTVGGRRTGACSLAGINAMELLINDILKLGGERPRLRAKAFGGATMVTGLSDVGPLNSTFTLEYLAQEGIDCLGHSLGGTLARNIMFWPATGRVLQKISRDARIDPALPAPPETPGNGIELL